MHMERLTSTSASVRTIQYLAYKMLHFIELLLQYIINSTIKNCFIFFKFNVLNLYILTFKHRPNK